MQAEALQQTTLSPAEELSQRIAYGTAGAMEMLCIYLGDQLGYYRVLAEGPLTSIQLSGRTGTGERYAREWLEQQVMAGILAVDDSTAPAHRRRYSLTEGCIEVLVNPDHPEFSAPFAQVLAGIARASGQLPDAIRTGTGIPMDGYGHDLREGLARLNRMAWLEQLPGEWIPAVPGLKDRLESDTGARVADIGCGYGWSSVGLARAFPGIEVDGFDIDAPSVDAARTHVWLANLHSQIRFHHMDAAEAYGAGQYDLVIACDALHDFTNPVRILESMRQMTRREGFVVLVERTAADTSNTATDWLLHGWSVLHTLPAGMNRSRNSAASRVVRTETIRKYADTAGFNRVAVIPVRHPAFTVYQLHLSS